jgi:replicative DNA helicase
MAGDTAAEKAVLSGLLNFGNDAYAEISHLLGNGEPFTLTENRELFQCLKYAFAENADVKPDLFLVQSTARQIGLDSVLEVDNSSYIQRLFTYAGDRSNLIKFAKRIKKFHVVRELQDKLEESKKLLKAVDGSESILDICAKAEGPILGYINSITGNDSEGVQHIAQGIDEYFEDLENNPNAPIGISSGYSRYDQIIGGGFGRKAVHIIGARTGIGKSLIGINVALHVAGKLKIPVLYLDTEMDNAGHWQRIIPRLSQNKVTIDDIKFRRYVASESKKETVRKARNFLKKIPLDYINISGIGDFDETLSIIRRWLHMKVGFDSTGRRNDCLIILDYLKMTGAEGLREMQEYQAMGFMVTKLHDFTVQTDTPCLSFVQLNRDGIDNETTAAISQSDRIAWLGSSVSIFKMKTEEEIEEDGGEENGNRKLIPVKTRFGEGLRPGDYINMHCKSRFGEIKEGVTRNELRQGTPAKPTEKGFPTED